MDYYWLSAGMDTRRQWSKPRPDRDETFAGRRDRDVEMHVVINAVVNKLT